MRGSPLPPISDFGFRISDFPATHPSTQRRQAHPTTPLRRRKRIQCRDTEGRRGRTTRPHRLLAPCRFRQKQDSTQSYKGATTRNPGCHPERATARGAGGSRRVSSGKAVTVGRKAAGSRAFRGEIFRLRSPKGCSAQDDSGAWAAETVPAAAAVFSDGGRWQGQRRLPTQSVDPPSRRRGTDQTPGHVAATPKASCPSRCPLALPLLLARSLSSVPAAVTV